MNREMDILLVNVGPVETTDGFFQKGSKPWFPPMSILTVAGTIHGRHRVEIWDEFRKGPVPRSVIAGKDLVGGTWLSPCRYGGVRLIEDARAMGVPTIVGGHDVTGLLKDGQKDYVYRYFGSAVNRRVDTPLMEEIISHASRKDMQSIYSAPNERPWEFRPYRYGLSDLKDCVFSVEDSSRGCDKACGFCSVGETCMWKCHSKPTWVQERNLNYLFSHGMRFYADTADSFGVNYEFDMDETLPLRRRYDMMWFTEMQASHFVGAGEGRKEMAAAMKKAGCVFVYIGLEGMINMGKNKQEYIDEAIKLSRATGIRLFFANVLDWRGDETIKDTKELTDWHVRGRFFGQPSLVALTPGTPARRQAVAKGGLIDDDPRHLGGSHPTRDHVSSPQERLDMLEYYLKHVYSWRRRIAGVVEVITDKTLSLRQRLVLASLIFQCLLNVTKSVKNWRKKGYFKIKSK